MLLHHFWQGPWQGSPLTLTFLLVCTLKLCFNKSASTVCLLTHTCMVATPQLMLGASGRRVLPEYDALNLRLQKGSAAADSSQVARVLHESVVDTAVTCRARHHAGSTAACAHFITFAGEHEISEEALLNVTEDVACLALSSRSLAVDLFCDGVLGMLLRAAQRLLAAQPHADRENAAIRIMHGRPGDAEGRGVAHLLDAFGAAVPQARARLLPEQACKCISCCCHQSLSCFSLAQVEDAKNILAEDVSARTCLACPLQQQYILEMTLPCRLRCPLILH